MKLTAIKSSIVETFDLPGILRGTITHNIKDGVASVVWTGPKLSVELWHGVLAFFRDTYNATKSECQVRLYVNTQTNVWAAWAFPQEARSYMSAQEINNPDAQEQRAMFKDSEGWTYCGTVHHHCSATAFQSGTDRQNEKTQDGLHITVGKLDEAHYDMHARFYLAGAEFNPDMSAFWDIGHIASVMIPAELHDIAARHQMTIPAPVKTEYPDQWKTNLVEIKTYQQTQAIGFHHGGTGNGVGNGATVHGIGDKWSNAGSADMNLAPEYKRKEMALGELRTIMKARNQSMTDLDAALAMVSSAELLKVVRGVAARNRVSLFDIVDEWEWEQDMKEMQEQGGGM